METMEQKDREYGIPEQKKFLLDTRAHVISAVKFFNWAEPRYRKELARRIVKKIKEYGITLTPSDTNDFYKYYMPESINHSGIHGMKWYRRRWQYKDGTFTPEGRIHYADSIRKHEEFLARKNGFKAFEDMRDAYSDVSVKDIPKQKESFIEKILKDLF